MFSRPTLAELVQRTRNDVLARLKIDDPLRREDAEQYAKVMAGAVHGLYGYIDWLATQLIYDTAEGEMLERWASIWLRVPRKAAAAAIGSVTFTIKPGAPVLSGTQVQALDGQVYETTADATGAAPSVTAPVVAVDAGKAGNRAAGETLFLVSPLDGVQTAALATAMTGGADIESYDDLRARLLFRLKSPPHGGAVHDYVSWMLEVPGVTRAWCYPLELGVGTVVGRFVRDNDASPIPGPSEVAAVQAHINENAPVQANATIVAPISDPLNFTFSSLTPATPAVKAAVEAELRDLLLRAAIPGGTILLSQIRAAISSAVDETDYVLSAPAANVVSATGHMSEMGTITWP